MSRIFIAGHKGMVGSAICRRLAKNSDNEIITADRAELDLRDQLAVHEFMADNKINEVYLAAAKVGGIHANNTYPANFIYDNLMIQNNVIHGAYLAGIRKLLFLGSSCIYPKLAPQPIKEDALLTGVLEPTNEPYAIAKIAGIKTCESYNRQYGVDFRSLMPTNLYGPGDNYHPDNSHVIPGLIHRFHVAKEMSHKRVDVWGTGKPRREFLFVDDLADAAIFVMGLQSDILRDITNLRCSHINVGSGQEMSILELAKIIAEVVGFSGEIAWDATKPDGTMRKFMDSSVLKGLGWCPKVNFRKGLRISYESYKLCAIK